MFPLRAHFVASNGELAWNRRDIEQSVHAVRDSGRAILGVRSG
jgi:hypothetical protein